jgi:hypothetical protein
MVSGSFSLSAEGAWPLGIVTVLPGHPEPGTKEGSLHLCTKLFEQSWLFAAVLSM